MAALTWLGHASFVLESDAGKRIYVDPWLSNPKAPEGAADPERVDVIALTHGHSDHVGETVELSRRFPDARIVAIVELKSWLGSKGANVEGQPPGLNKGGSEEIDGVRFTLVNAFHSSSSDEREYLGEACGIVVSLEQGTVVYFAGDTCAFGDMRLIQELYAPGYAVLPVGDHFTMGPREAARALELLGNPVCIPCHYGTFPLLAGTPEELAREAPSARIQRLEPGETVELG